MCGTAESVRQIHPRMMGLPPGVELQSPLFYFQSGDIQMLSMQFPGESRGAVAKKKHFNTSPFKHSTHPKQAA